MIDLDKINETLKEKAWIYFQQIHLYSLLLGMNISNLPTLQNTHSIMVSIDTYLLKVENNYLKLDRESIKGLMKNLIRIVNLIKDKKITERTDDLVKRLKLLVKNESKN